MVPDLKHNQSDEKSTREDRGYRVKAVIFLLIVFAIGVAITFFSGTWISEIKVSIAMESRKDCFRRRNLINEFQVIGESKC